MKSEEIISVLLAVLSEVLKTGSLAKASAGQLLEVVMSAVGTPKVPAETIPKVARSTYREVPLTMSTEERLLPSSAAVGTFVRKSKPKKSKLGPVFKVRASCGKLYHKERNAYAYHKCNLIESCRFEVTMKGQGAPKAEFSTYRQDIAGWSLDKSTEPPSVVEVSR